MKTSEFEFISVEETPEQIEEGKVYMCKAFERIDLMCPCGCGKQIILNTIESSRPRWKTNGNTLIPSVKLITGCQTHFSITNGKVIS